MTEANKICSVAVIYCDELINLDQNCFFSAVCALPASFITLSAEYMDWMWSFTNGMLLFKCYSVKLLIQLLNLLLNFMLNFKCKSELKILEGENWWRVSVCMKCGRTRENIFPLRYLSGNYVCFSILMNRDNF